MFPGASDGEVDHALYNMQPEEGQRYTAFFATLEHAAPQLISRSTAVEFFAKSALTHEQVDALYASIKTVGVTPDAAFINETQFIMAMHLIVCRTKRGLAQLPSAFPSYLFPTLSLSPVKTVSSSTSSSASSHADLIRGMPSPEKPPHQHQCSSFTTMNITDQAPPDPFSSSSSSSTVIAKLTDSQSVVDLAQRDASNSQVLTATLVQVDASETAVLQHLQATLASLAHAVEQLGFAVPPASYATIGSLDDFGNLLCKNVQSLKQEIQSLEISAQMRSIADEATQRTNSGNVAVNHSLPPRDGMAQIATLTQQLAALQRESTQLQEKKDALSTTVVARSKDTVAATGVRAQWSAVSTAVPRPVKTETASPVAPPSSSASSIGVGNSSSEWGGCGTSTASPSAASVDASSSTSSDVFGFGTSPVVASQPPPQAGASDDFGWGAFQ